MVDLLGRPNPTEGAQATLLLDHGCELLAA
jgi:hypothetical protein